MGLFATDGRTNAQECSKITRELIAAFALAGAPILSFASNGAATEIKSQDIIVDEHDGQYLEYNLPQFGLKLRAPILAGSGPCIPIQDPSHAKKTLRDNCLSGAVPITIGNGMITYQNVLNLLSIESGLLRSDIINSDKQDDGAAVRFFSADVIQAMIGEDNTIAEDEKGLLVFLSIFGQSECYVCPLKLILMLLH